MIKRTSDKVLLEGLINKYGKNFILNEISFNLLDRAEKSAIQNKDYKRAATFRNEYMRKSAERYNIKHNNRNAKNIINNLSFNCLWKFGKLNNMFRAIFIDETYPIAINYISEAGGASVYIQILTTPDFVDIINHEDEIIYKLCKSFNLPEDDYPQPISFTDKPGDVDTFAGVDFLFPEDKKYVAKRYVNALNVINNKLGTNYNMKWEEFVDWIL